MLAKYADTFSCGHDILGNSPLQSPQEMLGVGLYDQLDVPVSAILSGVDDINHHIGQRRLGTWV